MRLPGGRLVRSRVVADPRTALVDALDRELTGYAVLEPQGALLLDDDGDGVVTFRDGVPVVAYHTGTGRGGPPALADLAAAGPYRLELVATDAGDLREVHGQESFRVPPGMPAERLAGDQRLADRTREALPETGRERGPGSDGRVGPAVDGCRDGGAQAVTTGEGGRQGNRRADAPSEAAASSTEGPQGGADTGGDRGTADSQAGAVEAFLDDEDKIEALREEARAEAEERAEKWGFATGDPES